MYTIERLTDEHLDTLLSWYGGMATSMRQSYMSPGSVGYCLLENGIPVMAGGIVNMQWHRGEAWILPNDWFRSHVKTCLRQMRKVLPEMAWEGRFHRVQATCATSISVSLFRHLGFYHEGTLNRFGPNGETCFMYARIFD